MPRRHSANSSRHAVSGGDNGIKVTLFNSGRLGGTPSTQQTKKAQTQLFGVKKSPGSQMKRSISNNQGAGLVISIKNNPVKKRSPYDVQRRRSAPPRQIPLPFDEYDEQYESVGSNNGVISTKPVPFQSRPSFQNFTIDAYDVNASSTSLADCCDIKIENIPSSVKMSDLIPIFSRFGTIKSAKTTSKGGSLHIAYESPGSAHKALEYHEADLKGNQLSVKLLSVGGGGYNGGVHGASENGSSASSLRPTLPRQHHSEVKSIAPDMATVFAGLSRR